jgi:ferredoxin-NADP reductase/predicted pyridoxine 5'-phosphate oxidase superfamily flavin-nucleotide-binding protein
MAFSMAMDWNEGEHRMHNLLHVPEYENPTSAMLTPQAAFLLQRAPLLAIGTLDSQDRPWTTVWGGAPGFSEPLGGGIMGTRTIVDSENDPVVQALVGDAPKGEMMRSGDKMIAGLTIDLMTRKRVKIAGRMLASSVGEVNIEYDEGAPKIEGAPETQDQMQFVYKVDQSLGNCPKYLNQYEIKPALVTSKLVSKSPTLSTKAKELVGKSDMFFLSSTTTEDMDTNHRGGPKGFVRVLSDTEIVYPEYSGNRLYQSLGNLQMNPKIGITFPDYETGDVLYITGHVDILVLDEAAKLLPGSNLVVKIHVDEARFVEGGLPFRGFEKTPSPYNPLVRTLPTEGNMKSVITGSRTKAKLIKKTIITPTIARFTFSDPGGISYKPGQWVAFDFSQELDWGYSHMRDEDPQSLNDDFVRTFTISSEPLDPSGVEKSFDITIRKVGVATSFLFGLNDRAGFEVPILGVGGDFQMALSNSTIDSESNRPVSGAAFVAGGLGITPLLGQIQALGLDKPASNGMRLHWTLRAQDIAFVEEILNNCVPHEMAGQTAVYLTGKLGSEKEELALKRRVDKLTNSGYSLIRGRMTKEHLLGENEQGTIETWYLCAAKPLRKNVLAWLEGKKVLFEDFDY